MGDWLRTLTAPPEQPALVRLGLLAAILTLVADQASKNLLLYGYDYFAQNPVYLDRGGVIVREVFALGGDAGSPPWVGFDLAMAWNRGVSFSMFEADSLAGLLMLIGFALIVVTALSLWLLRVRHWILALGLGLVIGGAIGNVIDRGIYGAVADFFYFHAFGRGWYIFNIADVGICVGVGLLLWDSIFEPGARSDTETIELDDDVRTQRDPLAKNSVVSQRVAAAVSPTQPDTGPSPAPENPEGTR